MQWTMQTLAPSSLSFSLNSLIMGEAEAEKDPELGSSCCKKSDADAHSHSHATASAAAAAITAITARVKSGASKMVDLVLNRVAGRGSTSGTQHSHGGTWFPYATCNRDHSMHHAQVHLPHIDPASVGIHDAARMGFIHRVRDLLEDNTMDPNIRDSENLTPLHRAILANQIAVSKYLVERGALIDLQGGALEQTPLHCAAR